MRKSILTVTCLAALQFLTAVPSLAAVNCGIVNKDIKLGRKPEDIAERMGISVADVQTCKQQGAGTTTPGTGAAPKADTATKPVPAPGTQGK